MYDSTKKLVSCIMIKENRVYYGKKIVAEIKPLSYWKQNTKTNHSFIQGYELFMKNNYIGNFRDELSIKLAVAGRI
jgi:hypothetical protein